MTAQPRSVTVLGSTGSVGTQTVELLAAAPERFQIRALVAGRNVALLAQQAVALQAERAVIADPACYAALREALSGTGIEVAAGAEAVVAAAALPADLDDGRDHRRRRPRRRRLPPSVAAPSWRWPTRRRWSAPAR